MYSSYFKTISSDFFLNLKIILCISLCPFILLNSLARKSGCSVSIPHFQLSAASFNPSLPNFAKLEFFSTDFVKYGSGLFDYFLLAEKTDKELEQCRKKTMKGRLKEQNTVSSLSD